MLEPDDDISRDNFDFQPPCEAMAYNKTSGNATRDRLAALVSETQEPLGLTLIVAFLLLMGLLN
ncbi:unnamed protein product [Leuciscus chuanchicus]